MMLSLTLVSHNMSMKKCTPRPNPSLFPLHATWNLPFRHPLRKTSHTGLLRMGLGRHKPPCSDDRWPTSEFKRFPKGLPNFVPGPIGHVTTHESSFATQESNVSGFQGSVPVLFRLWARQANDLPPDSEIETHRHCCFGNSKCENLQQLFLDRTEPFSPRFEVPKGAGRTAAPLQRAAIGPVAPHSAQFEALGWWPVDMGTGGAQPPSWFIPQIGHRIGGYWYQADSRHGRTQD